MSEDHNKEFKILICVISGIAVASFIYLIYKDWKNEQQKLSSLKSLQNRFIDNNILYPTTSLTEDTDIKTMITNQEKIISNQHEQINNIISLLKNNNQSTYSEEKTNIMKSTFQPSVAGNVLNLKPSVQDRIRQNKFGLL